MKIDQTIRDAPILILGKYPRRRCLRYGNWSNYKRCSDFSQCESSTLTKPARKFEKNQSHNFIPLYPIITNLWTFECGFKHSKTPSSSSSPSFKASSWSIFMSGCNSNFGIPYTSFMYCSILLHRASLFYVVVFTHYVNINKTKVWTQFHIHLKYIDFTWTQTYAFIQNNHLQSILKFKESF